MTYHELWLKTVRVAQNLQKREFGPSQVFVFMAENTDYLAPAVFASFCLACPISPLHPMLSKDEISHNLKKTKPSVVFCDVSSYNKMEEALKDAELHAKIFTFGGKSGISEPVENLFTETGVEDDFK